MQRLAGGKGYRVQESKPSSLVLGRIEDEFACWTYRGMSRKNRNLPMSTNYSRISNVSKKERACSGEESSRKVVTPIVSIREPTKSVLICVTVPPLRETSTVISRPGNLPS